MIFERQDNRIVIVDECCIKDSLNDVLEKYCFCQCESMLNDRSVIGSIVDIQFDTSTPFLECHFIHLTLGVRIELVAWKIRIMRWINIIVLHLLCHVLINFRLLWLNYAIVWRKDVVAETEERQTVAFLFFLSCDMCRHIVKSVSIRKNNSLGFLNWNILKMFAFLEQYELFRRHDWALEIPDHLDNLGIVFQFGVEMGAVSVEDLHQFSLDSKILD